MRIAYVCADFGIPIGGHKGASVHVREMVAALVLQGHDVRVFTPNPGSGNPLDALLCQIEPSDRAVPMKWLAARIGGHGNRAARELRELFYNLAFYRQARTQFRLWRPDVIFERYSLFNLSGIALARRLGIPHLLEVNAPLRIERGRTKGLTFEPFARMVERTVFGTSDRVLVVSTALRDYVVGRGAHLANTLVLPNAVDARRFHPHVDGREARARWGLGSDAFVVGFAGSLKPWHGVDILLAAFADLKRQEPAARLLIVGEGPCEESLTTCARDLGIDDSVIFTGTAAYAEMPELLAAMDVAVAPYTAVPDFYFSPLKIYEYMASGRAIVASAVGEIGSQLGAGQTGVLRPPGDAKALYCALVELLADPCRRARLGAAAREEALAHTWEGNARTVARVGATLLEHRLVSRSEVMAARRP